MNDEKNGSRARVNRAVQSEDSRAECKKLSRRVGIEMLVNIAAVNSEFREELLSQRADAAATMGVKLQPAEVALLRAIPEEQLATLISQTAAMRKEPRGLERAFQALMRVFLPRSSFKSSNRPNPSASTLSNPEHIFRVTLGHTADRP